MQVIKDTYEWLTVAYGEKKFTRKEQREMTKTVRGLMVEEFNELIDAIKEDNKKEQINAIADLMFVTLNDSFFKIYTVEYVLDELKSWRKYHTQGTIIKDGIISYSKSKLVEEFTPQKYASNYFPLEDQVYTDLVLLDLQDIGINLGFTQEEIEEECRKVFLSNMTKFCRTKEDAIRTVEKYKNGTHPNKTGVVIEATYKPTGHEEFPYRIERVSDRKLLKADTFKDVDQF